MTSSINSNLSAAYAQVNIANAQNQSSASVQRLSSGNRIVTAADDVTALATGTSLNAQVTALNTALTNVSQGSSLLQVANGALNQVTSILQRQQAIALQAGSGSLTNTDRSYLNQEFQALSQQINQISTSTNFNGVNLLDGSLSTSAALTTNTANATAGSASLNFTQNLTDGQNVVINGVVFSASSSNASTGTATPAANTTIYFAVGQSLADTLSNLATQVNASATNSNYSAALGGAAYSVNGSSLVATAAAGGSLSNSFSLGGVVTGAATGFTTHTNSTVDLTGLSVSDIAKYQIGQNISVNTGNNTAISGLATSALHGKITAISGTTLTFTAAAAATGSASTGTASTITLDNAANDGSASVSGGLLNSSFNLFTGTTNFTSATQAVSASSSSAAAPFQEGDSITASVNGGTAQTLFTFASAATNSLTDVVNGINAKTGTTGFSAALTYDQTNKYNIKISYAGNAGNVVLDAGTNFNTSPTTSLTGDLYGTTAGNVTEAVGGHKTIISTGYIDVTGAAGSHGITVGDQVTSVVAANIAGATSAAIPFVNGDQISITQNGKATVLHTLTTGDTLNDIIADINSKTANTGVVAALTGTGGGYNIRLYATTQNTTGSGDQISVNAGANIQSITSSAVTKLTTTHGGLTQNVTGSLAGGVNNGLGQNSVTVTGTTGNGILTGLSQTAANVQLIMTQNAVAGTSTLAVGGHTFAFTNNTTNAAPDEILVGATIQDTLNNAVNTINNYLKNGYAQGDAAYQLNQMNLSVTNGNTLNFTGNGVNNVTTLASTLATPAYSTVTASITGSSTTNSGLLSNAASAYGINTTGITNSAFSGQIQGITAAYAGTNASTVNLSVKVGNNTYTANNVNMNVSQNTAVLFQSDTVNGKNGGYFSLQLAANATQPFTTQAGADAVASSLNSALSSMNFLQTQNVSSYTGSSSIVSGGTVIGSLLGTNVTAQLADPASAKISAVSVTTPTGSNTDAQISLTINGVNFNSASGIGNVLQANQTYKLTSANDPNQFVNFTTGSSTIDLSTAANATAVQSALETAFGATAGSAALQFQTGVGAGNSLAVSIGSSSTSALFGGQTLDVLSQADATAASTAVAAALSTVVTMTSAVGALEERFNYATATLQSAQQNESAAASNLLDTNVATESTNYATTQVKTQGGIAVLAQANQSLQLLLKLIG